MNKTLVTGGGSGIGFAIARHLSKAGHDVVITGRNADRLAEAGLAYAVMDVTDPASVKTCIADHGPFDIVISNAGAARTAPALKTSLEDWNAMIAVNMTGAFNVAQAAIPDMVSKGFGRFIVIASTSSLKAYPYTLAYAASKHGVLGLVRSLALELAKTGVTSNAICPGFTDTDIVGSSVQNIIEKTGRSEEQALAAFTADNPMGRLIDPQEVAETAAWLCTEGAKSVNGQAIAIDGGELIS